MRDLETQPQLHTFAAQRGLTLIELTVVLLILIGLAGLLLPYVSGFVEKTHDGTNTSNLAELNGAIGRFEVQYQRSPDNLEALINGVAGSSSATDTTCASATINTVYCKIISNSTTSFTPPFTTTTLATSTSLKSLNDAGISTVYYNKPDTANATFDSLFDSDATTVGIQPKTLLNGDTLAAVTCSGTGCTVEDTLATTFGVPSTNFNATCYDYVAFGVGQASELTNRVLANAPVVFSSEGDSGPTLKYDRFVAIYQVDKNNTTPCTTSTDKAKFIGTASPRKKLMGLSTLLGNAYDRMSTQ